MRETIENIDQEVQVEDDETSSTAEKIKVSNETFWENWDN